MALKNCPECKKELSNTVDKCIHCGCEVVLCPECEGLAMKGAESCQWCGASLVSSPKSEEAPVSTKETEPVKTQKKQSIGKFSAPLKELIAGCKKENPFIEGGNKASNTLTIIFIVIGVLFGLIVLLGFLANKLIESFDLVSALVRISVFLLSNGIIVYIISKIIFAVVIPYETKSLWNYANEKGVSLKELNDSAMRDNYSHNDTEALTELKVNIGYGVNAHYYNEVKGKLTSYLIIHILKIFTSVFRWGIWGFAAIFLPLLIDELSFGVWIVAILLVAIAIPDWIMDLIKKSHAKKRKAWLENQYGKKFDAFSDFNY